MDPGGQILLRDQAHDLILDLANSYHPVPIRFFRGRLDTARQWTYFGDADTLIEIQAGWRSGTTQSPFGLSASAMAITRTKDAARRLLGVSRGVKNWSEYYEREQ